MAELFSFSSPREEIHLFGGELDKSFVMKDMPDLGQILNAHKRFAAFLRHFLTRGWIVSGGAFQYRDADWSWYECEGTLALILPAEDGDSRWDSGPLYIVYHHDDNGCEEPECAMAPAVDLNEVIQEKYRRDHAKGEDDGSRVWDYSTDRIYREDGDPMGMFVA